MHLPFKFILAALAVLCIEACLGSPVRAEIKKSPKEDVSRAPRPADIDRNGVLILVRNTLLALDQANKTGNYTVLRELGSPGFQANNSAQLAEIFASQRKQGYDLSGLAVIEPQLTVLPQIEPDGKLHMAGFFPSVPIQVHFELLYAPVDRQWKLFGISVNFDESGPAAPATTDNRAQKPDVPVKLPDPPTPAVRPKAPSSDSGL